jgi:hypothetical protein
VPFRHPDIQAALYRWSCTSKCRVPLLVISVLKYINFINCFTTLPCISLICIAVVASFIHSSMALLSFVGPWPLLQFRNLFYTDGRTPWTSDRPVARPLPKQRAAQTQNKPTHKLPCLEWVSNIRSQCSSERRQFMPQTAPPL